MSESNNFGPSKKVDDNPEMEATISIVKDSHGKPDCPDVHDESAHNGDDSSSGEEEDEYDDDKQQDHNHSATADAIIPHTDQDFEGLDAPRAAPEEVVQEISIPSQELMNKIVQQVEYYFSDENIVKDDYLMKHIRRNKQGFVSLKVISSFHKMKKLTNDYRVVAYALEHASKKLHVSENRNKVKRIDPLPRLSDKLSTDCSKSVIATPISTTSIDELKKLFGKCGNVLKVNVFTDDNLPPWLKTLLEKRNRPYHTPFAVIEYDSSDSANSASKTLTNTSDWRRGMKVDVLAKTKSKGEGKEKENKQNVAQGEVPKTQKKKKKTKKKDTSANRISELQAGVSSSGSDIDKATNLSHEHDEGIPIPSSPKPNVTYSKSFGGSPSKSAAAHHQNNPTHHIPIPANRHGGLGKSPLACELDDGTRIRSNSFGPLSSSPGRWIQKKLQDGAGSASGSTTTVMAVGAVTTGGGSDRNISSKDEHRSEFVHKKVSEGFTRAPKGPDGSKGFRLKRVLPQN